MRRSGGHLRAGILLLSLLVGMLALSTSAFAETVEFKPESPEETHEFKVPPGATQIQVTAVGGAGEPGIDECGSVDGSGVKGTGAKVTALLPVHEGENLFAVFGGGGDGG